MYPQQTDCSKVTYIQRSVARICVLRQLRKGAGIAQLAERPTEKSRRNTDAGSSPRCGKGFFSQSQLSVQSETQHTHTRTHANTHTHTHAHKHTHGRTHTHTHTHAHKHITTTTTTIINKCHYHHHNHPEPHQEPVAYRCTDSCTFACPSRLYTMRQAAGKPTADR